MKGINENKAFQFEKYLTKWGLQDYHFHISNQYRFGGKDMVVLTRTNEIKYYLPYASEMRHKEIRTISSLIKRKDTRFAIQHPRIDKNMVVGTDYTTFNNLEELLEYSLVRKISGI